MPAAAASTSSAERCAARAARRRRDRPFRWQGLEQLPVAEAEDQLGMAAEIGRASRAARGHADGGHRRSSCRSAAACASGRAPPGRRSWRGRSAGSSTSAATSAGRLLAETRPPALSAPPRRRPPRRQAAGAASEATSSSAGPPRETAPGLIARACRAGVSRGDRMSSSRVSGARRNVDAGSGAPTARFASAAGQLAGGRSEFDGGDLGRPRRWWRLGSWPMARASCAWASNGRSPRPRHCPRAHRGALPR